MVNIEKHIRLSELPLNKKGIINRIQAGRGLERRLLSRGIIPGKQIRMISPPYFRGPIVISIDNMEIALGYGITNKIIVKYQENG